MKPVIKRYPGNRWVCTSHGEWFGYVDATPVTAWIGWFNSCG